MRLRDGRRTLLFMNSAAPPSSLSDTVEARVVQMVECTIPAGMTIAEWRRRRPAAAPRAREWSSRALTAARRAWPPRTVRCDHLHDTTTRYDHAAKRLDFLLVCPVCRTEKLIESVPYEPASSPSRRPSTRFLQACRPSRYAELRNHG